MIDRYDRQRTLVDQEIISKAIVSVVGVGGLGCEASQPIVGLGVGRLDIYDNDKIVRSNLNRQSYNEDDIGKEKAPTFAEKLRKWNSEISIEGHYLHIDERTIHHLSDSDVIVDATDNFNTRVLLNRFAVRKRKPLVSGGMRGLRAQVAVYYPQKGYPCIDCKLDIERLAKRNRRERRRQHCDRNPDPAVATVSKIIGGIMAEQVRKILSPANEDDEPIRGILQYNALLDKPFILIPTEKRESCKCV